MNITETNRKIIELLAEGKVYKEVAAELSMKTRTVIDRIQELKKQNDCRTVTQLVVKYVAQTIKV